MAKNFAHYNPYGHPNFVTSLPSFEGLNIIASLVDFPLNLIGSVTFDGHPVSRAGRIYSISVRLSAPRIAGTLTVRFSINGVAVVGTEVVIDGVNPQSNFAIFTVPVVGSNFVANDRLGFTVSTTLGWLPITADIVVAPEVLYDDYL